MEGENSGAYTLVARCGAHGGPPGRRPINTDLTMTRTTALLALALPAFSLSGSAHAADNTLLDDVVDGVARRGYRVGVRALDAVDATPRQRRAVESAGLTLLTSLRTLDDETLAFARGAVDAWTAEEVDPAAVDDLRADAVELVDAASRPAATFVVEVGEVLTREQRAELVDVAASQARRLARRLR